MAPICFACLSTVGKKSPGQQCGQCNKFYHANSRCCELTRDIVNYLRSAPGITWSCSQCRSGGSARSPSRSPAVGDANSESEDGAAPNVADKTVFQPAPVPEPDDTAGLADAMRSIQHELRLLRESVTFCSDKVTDFEAKLGKLNDCVKATNELKAENVAMRTSLCALQARVDDMEQLSIANNLEIQGVPERASENLVTIIKSIGANINYPIENSVIDSVYRVPTRDPKLPKNIIVRLSNRRVRDEFIAAAKLKRLSSSHDTPGMKVDGVSDRLFVNEHLTRSNKLLFKDARAAAKDKHYKYVWVRGGRIFMRRDDRARVLLINSPEKIRNL